MKNTLDGKQMYALCVYVSNQWLLFETLSNTAISQMASEYLGYKVTSSNIEHAISSVGLEKTKQPSSHKDRVQVVARELVVLLKHLGVDPAKDLIDVSQRK